MKKVIKVVGVFVVLLIVFIGYFYYQFSMTIKEHTARGTPFINTFLPKISTWDIKQFDTLITPESLSHLKSKKGEMVIKGFSTLGVLKKFETPELIRVATFGDENLSTFFYCRCIF